MLQTCTCVWDCGHWCAGLVTSVNKEARQLRWPLCEMHWDCKIGWVWHLCLYQAYHPLLCCMIKQIPKQCGHGFICPQVVRREIRTPTNAWTGNKKVYFFLQCLVLNLGFCAYKANIWPLTHVLDTNTQLLSSTMEGYAKGSFPCTLILCHSFIIIQLVKWNNC